MDMPRFGQYLINNDIVTETMVMEALVIQQKRQENIARLAISKKYLSVKQVLTVFNRLADSSASFTDMAENLGYLTVSEVDMLKQQQRQSRPKIGEILVEMGVLKPATLDVMLEKYNRLAVDDGYTTED